MSLNFNQLLENSRQLTNHIITPGLPQLERELDQIETQSRKLFAKTTREGTRGTPGKLTGASSLDTRTAYLLANKGFDAEKVSETLQSINLTATFEPLQPLLDTDVESYLRHEHEMIILSAVEDGRRQTIRDFDDNFEKSLHRDWERAKKRVFDELGQHRLAKEDDFMDTRDTSRMNLSTAGQGSFFSTYGEEDLAAPSTKMVPKMKAYSKVVQNLNSARIKNEPFGIVSACMDVCRQGDKGDVAEQQMMDCWNLLACILNEKHVVKGRFQKETLKQMQYAEMYKSQEIDSGLAEDAVQFRQMVIQGSREFLHSQFWKFIDVTVHQQHAIVGGMPTTDRLVDAFINIKFKKYGQWTKSYIEVYENDQAIWAHLFYLLRSGHLKEASEYVNAHERDFARTDNNFTSYFKAWMSSKDGRLPKRLRETLLLFWNNQIRPLIVVDQRGMWVGGDPFRVVIYKMLGRCELNRKTIPGGDVLPSTEDYLWFQLMLVQEEVRAEDPVQERFTLRDMGKQMLKFGAKHFSANGKQPTMWALVLLLCGEFERAAQYLFCIDNFIVDAVHFAVAMAYYGVLRVPDSPNVGDAGSQLLNFRTVQCPSGNYELTYLNFARMIHQYTRIFSVNNPVEALHYIYIVGLFGKELEDIGEGSVFGSRTPGVAAESNYAREYTRLVQAYVREVILDNIDKLPELLGQVRNDGVRSPGEVEKFKAFIHIKTPQEFVLRIIKAAAEQCDRDGRFEHAIKLFDLAGEYDTVVAILNKRLGESLSEQRYAASVNVSFGYMSSPSKKSKSPVSDILSQAEHILQSYLSRQHTASRIRPERQQGCSVLLSLHRFMNFCESNDLFAAVETMDSLNLFPTRFEDAGNINRMAVDLQNLDEHVGRALPVVLISLMTALSKLFSLLKEGRMAGRSGKGDGVKQAQLEDLQSRAKALVVFSANVRYKIPSDVYGQLIKIEADMI